MISISLLLEVLLITIQQWRGVASHFNRTTAFDAQVDLAMFAMIVVAFVGILYFFALCCGRISLDPDYRVAARSGMFFLVVSCLIGFVIFAYGYKRVVAGLSPETFGERGVTKFPHGVAIHALQILPASVWLLRRLQLKAMSRVSVVNWLSVSFALQITFACYQTLAGRARFEIDTLSATLLMLATLVTIVVPVSFVFRDGRVIALLRGATVTAKGRTPR